MLITSPLKTYKPSVILLVTVSRALKATKVGQQWLIHRDDLKEYVDNKPRGGRHYHRVKTTKNTA